MVSSLGCERVKGKVIYKYCHIFMTNLHYKSPRVILLGMQVSLVARGVCVGLILVSFCVVPQQSAAHTADTHMHTTRMSEADRYRELLQVVAALQARLLLLQEGQPAQPTRTVSAVQTDRLYGPVPRRTIELDWYDTSASAVRSIPDERARVFFSRVRELAPAEYLPLLTTFQVYDRNDGFDAFVYGTYRSDRGLEWEFAVNRRFLAEGFTQASMDELVVHELSHVIGDSDTLQYATGRDCHYYFITSGGCPQSDSLYGQFVDEFWSTRQLNLVQGGIDADDMYDRYPDEFVSAYAATNPAEDFAESFTYYVLYRDDWFEDIAEDKVDFFDEFSYARDLRAEIRDDL